MCNDSKITIMGLHGALIL